MNPERLRTEVLELRVRERELVADLEELGAELEANRDRQGQLKALLVNAGKADLRLQSVGSDISAQAAMARMGAFTKSEAIAELGWESRKTTALIKRLVAGKVLEPIGRIGTDPRFRYVGPIVEEPDPEVEAQKQRDQAAFDALQQWALSQTIPFTPSQAAAGADVPRPTALRILRVLQESGALTDEGPTDDMPLFAVAGSAPVSTPPPQKIEVQRVTSKIPAISEMIEAAYAASCDVSEANGHLAVTAMDGQRAIIDSVPKGRSGVLRDKAKLRRIGVNV